MRNIPSHSIELALWTAALIYFFLIDPFTDQSISLCPIHHFGFTLCPGCGLGRSIAMVMEGDFAASFRTHWLGIPATAVLIFRIQQLVRFLYQQFYRQRIQP